MATRETITPRVRVAVTMLPSGGVLVTTHRLAEGADPTDPDPIVWVEDVAVAIPADRELRTVVHVTPTTITTPAELLPY